MTGEVQISSNHPIDCHKGFFIDLFILCTYIITIKMHEELGYGVFKGWWEYYGSLGVAGQGRNT
jgi:hypothetical protein